MNTKTKLLCCGYVYFINLAGIARNKRSVDMPIHFEADHPFIYFITGHDAIESVVPIFYGTLQSLTTKYDHKISHDEL